MIQIWFVVMIFRPGFAVMILIRFSYDFDMVSVVILDVGQTCFDGVLDASMKVETFFIGACLLCTWLACFRWGNANSSMVWAQLGKKQVHPHNCITTVSKPYQIISKNHKNLEKSTKSLSLGCFLHTWQTAGRQTDRQPARQPDRQPDS